MNAAKKITCFFSRDPVSPPSPALVCVTNRYTQMPTLSHCAHSVSRQTQAKFGAVMTSSPRVAKQFSNASNLPDKCAPKNVRKAKITKHTAWPCSPSHHVVTANGALSAICANSSPCRSLPNSAITSTARMHVMNATVGGTINIGGGGTAISNRAAGTLNPTAPALTEPRDVVTGFNGMPLDRAATGRAGRGGAHETGARETTAAIVDVDALFCLIIVILARRDAERSHTRGIV
mmetsp:Transcript_626/g.2424  ORF Transcript_626/g.2424 Transcript_626/m.2424 type:complete len:234 (+) Transcript_626:249-950(+)